MNFDKKIVTKKNHGIYERLDTALLPNLYIAYKIELGKVSGKVFKRHPQPIRKRRSVRDRHAPSNRSLADEGKQALLQRDVKKLNELMNTNFDLRCKIMNINESNMEMIRTARCCGASAKFAGSGGSIIGVYKDDDMLTRLIIELKKIKARVIKPYVI